MPDFSKLIEMSDALVQDHTVLDKRRCMPLRNTYSKCRLCVDACPTGAITLLPRTIEIEKSACVNCGACTTVCPVQALMPLTPTDTELAQEAVSAIEAAEGVACFACARIMARRGPDKTKVVAVDCLSRIEESLLLRLAAHGIDTIILADGDCATCKFKKCGKLAHDLAYETSELLMGMGSPVRIQCMTGVPESLHSDFTAQDLNEERRSLFFRTKEAAAETARTVASVSLKKATGIDITKKAAQDIQEEPQRHDDMLNALAELGKPQDMVVSSRRFATLSINEKACTSCKKCVLICPTKALSKSTIAREDAPGADFEIDASRCVRCKLCQHVCRDNAIELEDANMLDIFDFEPTLWPVPEQDKSAFVRNFFSQSWV